MKNLGYSQNFLVNKKLVERLISKSNIDVTDYVIEIGPGKGIIWKRDNNRCTFSACWRGCCS